eukprot:6112127-Prymnesium_polylepis.1
MRSLCSAGRRSARATARAGVATLPFARRSAQEATRTPQHPTAHTRAVGAANPPAHTAPARGVRVRVHMSMRVREPVSVCVRAPRACARRVAHGAALGSAGRQGQPGGLRARWRLQGGCLCMAPHHARLRRPTTHGRGALRVPSARALQVRGRTAPVRASARAEWQTLLRRDARRRCRAAAKGQGSRYTTLVPPLALPHPTPAPHPGPSSVPPLLSRWLAL